MCCDLLFNKDHNSFGQLFNINERNEQISSEFVLQYFLCFSLVRFRPHESIKVMLLPNVVVFYLPNPVSIYLRKGNNRNTRTRCCICLKLTIKKPERHHWYRSSVFIMNFEHILHLVLVFL